MNKYRINGNITDFLTAFFGCWAIQSSSGITVRNPLTVVLFLCIYAGALYVRKCKYNGKNKMLYTALPVAAGLMAGAGLARLIYPSASAEFTNSLFRIMTFGILFLGYFLLADLLVRAVFLLIKKNDFVKEESPNGGGISDNKWVKELPDKKGQISLLLLTAGICFICYLPYFLYEFPGIMTADSIVQYQQIVGVLPYSNHHPVIHTLTIRLFYELGMLVTGDPVSAISFYTFAQMMFMCICGGVLVKEILLIMGRLDIRIVAVVTAFLALVPFNAVFAVTVWKDVPFAGISVLFVCHIINMSRRGAMSVTGADFVIFGLLGVLFSLFRSNAWYAFIVFMPAFIYCFRARLKESVLTALLSIAIVVLVKGALFGAMGVTGPDFVESLSLPLQQVARVIVDDGKISESDLELIDEVIDRTYIRELYVGGYADNIKELVRAGNPRYLEENKGEYLGLWIRLGLKNPGEYIRAWYDLEGGYVYPDVAYKVADADGIMGNDLGLYPRPIIGGKFIKVKEILIKLSEFMPLYGMLFTIGAYCWGLVAALIAAVRRRRNVLPHILMMLLVLTLLIAAPVVDFRYGYAYVLTFPLLAAISFDTDKRSDS